MIRFASIAWLLAATTAAFPLAAQGGGRRAAPPAISARSFTGGSARVIVTGGFQIDAEVPINVEASIADGEMTWLQFGVSGSRDPNALITISAQEIGVSASRGRQIFTAEAASCSGRIDVSAATVTGRYACKGVTAFDAGTGKMSTVDVAISFTARS